MTTIAQLAAAAARRKRWEKRMWAVFALMTLALVVFQTGSSMASWRPFQGRIVGVQIDGDTVLIFRAHWGRITVERQILLRQDDAGRPIW